MHQCFHRRSPQYIVDLVSFRTGMGRFVPRRQERPSLIDHGLTSADEHSQSLAILFGSASLNLFDDHEQFREQLKTYYFNVAFS